MDRLPKFKSYKEYSEWLLKWWGNNKDLDRDIIRLELVKEKPIIAKGENYRQLTSDEFDKLILDNNVELRQDVFFQQPKEVDWCGVDYDGLLSFGKAINPRYTWASERWRGFELIGEPIKNTKFKPLTSLRRAHYDKEYEYKQREADEIVNDFDNY